MKDPLGVSPNKGNQGTTRGKVKTSFDLGGNRTHDLRIRSTVTLPTKLRGRTEKVGDDLGGESRRRVGRVTVDLIRRSCVRFPPRSKEVFTLPRVVPLFPLLGLTPSGSFMGFL